MLGGIYANTMLDYVEFQIYPRQNRYDVSVCCDNEVEFANSGLLEQLAHHSSKVKALSSKGSDTNFRLEPPDTLSDATWFSKSTLTRFLNIINPADILDKANAMESEISQLEEARRFHVSLYAKADDNSAASDSSKNELLRAMDLRLAALRKELADAFHQAAGAVCSSEDIIDIVKFSDHFGASDLRNSLLKFVPTGLENQTVDVPSTKRSSGNEKLNSQSRKPSLSDPPVRYTASPAKAAQVERQSSSEDDESSCTTEEDRPSVERSRPLMRSASPRRSASPMRRVQIGRSGSRRPAAITIKSLNFIPARDKLASQKDDDDESGEDGTTSKRSDINVRRMSVQDAINLFERKQRDQTSSDTQKTSSSSIPNKAVLRRWSAGMYESSKNTETSASENADSLTPNNLVIEETNLDSDPMTGPKTEVSEEKVCVQEGDNDDFDPAPTEREESKKLSNSAEWSRQKEAELNQLLIKMMETKPARYKKTAVSVKQDQQRSEISSVNNQHKEKVKGETARKRVGKETQVRAKPDVASGKVNSVSKRPVMMNKNSPESVIVKSEKPKPASVKKVPTKASTLPGVRKSWPSAPSPRASGGASPAKIPPPTTAAVTAARRRSHPTSLVPQKVERSKVPVKTSSNDTKKSVMSERNQQSVTKASKPMKTKPQAAMVSSDSSAKPKLHNKVAKKSSVVPLEPKDTPKEQKETKEPKPFLRKGSRTMSSAGPVTKKKISQPEKPLRNSVDIDEGSKNEKDPIFPEPVDTLIADSKIQSDPETETQLNTPEKYEEKESPDLVTPNNEDEFSEKQDTVANFEEETDISPAAWVEIEEPVVKNEVEEEETNSSADVAPVRAASPRVRHSLSQMLLEESSEPDIIDWGNAENPPTMVYQKDAPKGFKRLLKFARKSKNDVNSSGFSSPSVFSEGEDDTEESKGSKRGSDNLLKKATLHATNYHELPAQATIGQLVAQSISQKMEDGHVSASVTTTKAPRSFFSLSAFKGSKQTDSKLR